MIYYAVAVLLAFVVLKFVFKVTKGCLTTVIFVALIVGGIYYFYINGVTMDNFR